MNLILEQLTEIPADAFSLRHSRFQCKIVPLPSDLMLTMRRHAFLVVLVAVVFVMHTLGVDDNDPKLVRWRMQRILKEVSHTVETSFYDPKLNGVDWKASVETARQRIDKADHTGEMIAAIAGLLARLGDSHTVFIP